MLSLINERKTLEKVATQLEKHKLTYESWHSRFHAKGKKFNMGVGCINYECGTVACIGGHAYLLENPKQFQSAADYVNAFPERCETGLAALYYPSVYSGLPDEMDYDDISPEDAAKAIRRYLNGEEKFWDHVQPREGEE